LFPTELDAAPFAEQLESFITEGGPAALLDHLGDELALNTLQVDADAFSEWVRQDYKDAKQPPQLFKSILNGDFKPSGIWKAAAVRISRNDPKVRKWQLVGAFRNDFSIYGPQPLNGKRPVAFSFGHEWALRMGAAVSQNDNTVAIEVDEAILDKADIFAALPAFKYDYIKPAGEPCKIELAQCLYSHGLLAQVGRFKLAGKPVSLEVKDLNANWTRVKSGSYQVAEVLINGGPMPCALIVGNYEPGSDILNARISAPTADLMYLTSVRRLPSSLQATGQLKNLSASYKGSLIALQAIIEPDAVALLKRFPDLKPDDPRLHGLNPDTDAIEIDCALKDVVLNALSLNGERLKVQTGGHIRLTSRDLAWKNCNVQTEYRTPTYAVVHGFSGASLMVNSADPKSSLAKAYRAPGVPVNVNGDITFETPLNVATFMSAHDLLFAAFAGKQAAAPEKERRFTDFQHFVFTGNFKAPSIILGDTVLPPIDTQGVTLKSLKLSVPVLPLDLAGGKLVFSDTDFDASKAALFREEGKLAIKGVSFRTRLKLTDADLSKLLGGTAKGAYGIGGRVEAQGNLEGTNFSGADRLSWAGAVKFRLSNLALIAPTQQWSAENIAPWSAAFTELGPQVFAAFTKAASNDTSNVQDLAKDFPGDPGLRPASGLALALQVYLAKACGVENERLDFDAITPTIVIDKGQASIDPFLLVGTGKCQGLELQIRNVKMNLADEAFADEMMLYPVLIPTAAMERLYFARWPGPEQAQYKVDLREGKLPMRIYGRLSAPTVKYPWQELRALATRALFGRPAIHDLASLDAARADFTKNWGAQETDMKAAAAVGDRLGIGFPATITCRNQGHSVIDRVPGLPQSLVSKLSVSSPTISPFESLNALLHPEPDPAAQPVPLPPNKTPAPKPDPKQN
jgi:hypothetical protein